MSTQNTKQQTAGSGEQTSESESESTKGRWTPHGDYDWGEGTLQARRQRADSAPTDVTPPQGVGYSTGDIWTDAHEMRRAALLFEQVPGPLDLSEFENGGVYPDTLIHEKPAEQTESAGGTDWLALGKRGCGKTTHARQWAVRLMEQNPEEIVVWRGSPLRSGWAAFREWTTVWLPAGVDVESMWRSERRGVDADAVDLEDEVRRVNRYEDPVDLLDQLGEQPGGSFHVVYPDPAFKGCEQLTAETDRTSDALPFTPAWEAGEDETATPLQHWWFGFLLAAVEFREAQYWLSLIFDEAGDLAPDDAANGPHKTWSKVSLLRSIYADSRRSRLSLYWSAHYEENLHPKFRREIERRISMPDGSPNPRKGVSRSIPLGFDTVRQEDDWVGRKDVGHALMFDEGAFDPYKWKDMTRKGDDARWLKISFNTPDGVVS
jgi:hypothetical protein